jgi:prevent-host-death family protein
VSVTVGVRELRENLSAYLDRVQAGEEVIVTERGRRVARIVGPSKLDQLIAEGRANPPRRAKQPVRLEDLPAVDGSPGLAEVAIRDKG